MNHKRGIQNILARHEKGHLDRDVKYTVGAKKTKKEAFMSALMKIKFDITTPKPAPVEKKMADEKPEEVDKETFMRNQKRKREEKLDDVFKDLSSSDEEEAELRFGMDESAEDILKYAGENEKKRGLLG